jgi:hypothetical protein
LVWDSAFPGTGRFGGVFCVGGFFGYNNILGVGICVGVLIMGVYVDGGGVWGGGVCNGGADSFVAVVAGGIMGVGVLILVRMDLIESVVKPGLHLVEALVSFKSAFLWIHKSLDLAHVDAVVSWKLTIWLRLGLSRPEICNPLAKVGSCIGKRVAILILK